MDPTHSDVKENGSDRSAGKGRGKQTRYEKSWYGVNKNTEYRGRKSDVDKAATVKKTGLVVSEGKVKGKTVQVLRDQGCTTVLVKRTSMVPKSQFTRKKVKQQLANGMKVTCPEALITVETLYYCGETIAACMKRPVYDLVIGNIEGVNDGRNEAVNAVVTRSQSLVEGGKKQVNLKI
ncbi:hypothetical protein Pcinc_020554 [Petrolisthes cinctipes]|uniref:Uncharacterized protein n=1 Tax=Petrolisthes cinctipes TaxID=88211 RepID=A0AAE1KGB1_PETCI|nr:hypothetical protein Pcinc_020554 [Petrolisthes cinctipes]